MRDPDPFLLSTSEKVTTGAMRANGTIPHDWRCIEFPWQHVAIFDKIIEIGGANMRILTSSTADGKKRGRVVIGPEASKRFNEQAYEILALFTTVASAIETADIVSQDAA